MSSIDRGFLFCVTRVKVTFECPLNGLKSIGGTGFCLKINNSIAFITNKHNIDPTLKLGKDTSYTLNKIEVELGKFVEGQRHRETAFYEISNLNSSLKIHQTADCAALIDPTFKNMDPHFELFPLCIENEQLAGIRKFQEIKELALPGSFIGFPVNWYDTHWNLPIVRSFNIACLPEIPFTNLNIQTSDVHLVSGLSFKGSSGSLVMMHSKGIDGLKIGDQSFIPCSILGIMSGHFWNDADEKIPEMFRHSGLSYYTRSSAMRELLGLPTAE